MYMFKMAQMGGIYHLLLLHLFFFFSRKWIANGVRICCLYRSVVFSICIVECANENIG